ncbi:hypothetical protein M513_10017 [Trichuris suis]|uniref:Uncharacterized protein n=1 Tax=Trichuris suis TaxID=68888 RepID=A0A085LVS9_9BILA|nr:hypothetical protein M513_10017 [Trichuris suis]
MFFGQLSYAAAVDSSNASSEFSKRTVTNDQTASSSVMSCCLNGRMISHYRQIANVGYPPRETTTLPKIHRDIVTSPKQSPGLKQAAARRNALLIVNIEKNRVAGGLIEGMAVPLSKSILQHLWDKFDCFLLDCDGVLWRGSVPIPGAGAAIDLMKKHVRILAFIMKNSSDSTRHQRSASVRGKMSQAWHQCVHRGESSLSKEIPILAFKNDIVTSSRVASIYLKNLPNRTGKVYVLGGQGLGNELKAANVDHFGIGPDYSENHTFVDDQSVSVELENDVFAVLVGFDRYICYNKMVKAVSYLRNEKCLFLATNDDAFFPSENSRIALPGAGSIVQAISYSSQRKPIVLGKPHSPMFQYVRDVLKIDPKKTMMIGDWPPTDIRFARRNGLASMLVLSGNATIEHAQKPEDRETTAYFYCNSLKTLCDLESVSRFLNFYSTLLVFSGLNGCQAGVCVSSGRL